VHLFMGDSPKYNMGTEDSCFVGNVASTGASNDVYIAGSVRYQSYGDRFVSWRNVSIGVATDAAGIVDVWHSVFFDDPNRFRDGHVCDIPEYEAAWDSYSFTFLKESVPYTPPGYTGSGSGDPGDNASAMEDTPWATRVPPATPMNDVAPTFYTPHVALPITNYSIRVHTLTGSFVAVWTSGLVDSNVIVASQGLKASHSFSAPQSCTQSGEWADARSLASSKQWQVSERLVISGCLGHFSASGRYGLVGSHMPIGSRPFTPSCGPSGSAEFRRTTSLSARIATRGESPGPSRSNPPTLSQSAAPVALSSDQTFLETMITTVSRVGWMRSETATVSLFGSAASFVAGSMTSYFGHTDSSESVTVVDLWTYSWTWYAVTSVIYMDIPLYETVTTHGFVVVLISTATPAASKMGDSLLIGIATGAAVVLVIIIAGALYLVRSSRHRALTSSSDDSQADNLATSQDTNRGTALGNSGEDIASGAPPSPHNLAARYGTMMEPSDEEPVIGEERELFV
jgi:hypothetical protein